MRATPLGSDGRIHPNRLLVALQEHLEPDAALIADGGDFLSFARIGLSASTYLDPGSLGCLGVGTPFGIAASLAYPDRQVVVATGDGALASTRWKSIQRCGIRRDCSSSSRTTARGRSRYMTIRYVREGWSAPALQSVDYAAMARAFGMHGERVERIEDLDGAIKRGLRERPALLDVVVSSEARSSDGSSGLATVPDLQALEAWDRAEREWRQDGESPATVKK